MASFHVPCMQQRSSLHSHPPPPTFLPVTVVHPHQWRPKTVHHGCRQVAAVWEHCEGHGQWQQSINLDVVEEPFALLPFNNIHFYTDRLHLHR